MVSIVGVTPACCKQNKCLTDPVWSWPVTAGDGTVTALGRNGAQLTTASGGLFLTDTKQSFNPSRNFTVTSQIQLVSGNANVGVIVGVSNSARTEEVILSGATGDVWFVVLKNGSGQTAFNTGIAVDNNKHNVILSRRGSNVILKFDGQSFTIPVDSHYPTVNLSPEVGASLNADVVYDVFNYCLSF